MNNDDTRLKAEKIISNYTKGGALVGLLPWPVIDTLVVAAIQLKMLKSISDVYNVPFSDNSAKAAISALLGSVVPISLRSSLVSLFKSNPASALVGIVGSLGMSAFSGGATYAMGKVFILHFESGGTLLNFDAEKLRAYYQEQLSVVKQLPEMNYSGVKP